MGQGNPVSCDRERRSGPDAVAVRGLTGRQSLEGALQDAARAGRLEDFVVLDEDRRIDESFVHPADPHQYVHRGPSTARHVVGETRPKDQFGPIFHEVCGLLGARGGDGFGVEPLDLIEAAGLREARLFRNGEKIGIHDQGLIRDARCSRADLNICTAAYSTTTNTSHRSQTMGRDLTM